MRNGLFYYNDESVHPVVLECGGSIDEARFTIFVDKTKGKIVYGERTFKDAIQLIPEGVYFELVGYRSENLMLCDLFFLLRDTYLITKISPREKRFFVKGEVA